MENKSLLVSIVVPLYNEEESLPELCEWIDRVLKAEQIDYEVLLIDDGSKDGSWAVVRKLSAANPAVRGIRFNRNYGKSAALDTGFKACRGDVVVTMDADLQDSPDELPGLVRMIREEGYDLVSGWKKKRYDPISKTIPSKFFNWVTSKISGIKLHDFNCGLKAYRGEVIKNIEVYGEMHRYIPLIAKWNGFSYIGEKVVEHRARKYGVTKFGLERFVFGFLDLLSINFVSRYKKRPMHFFGTIGTLFFLFGMAVTFWLIGEKVYSNWFLGEQVRAVVDQPLFFLALVAVIIGVQLFLAGFLGELINVASRRKKEEYLVIESTGITSK